MLQCTQNVPCFFDSFFRTAGSGSALLHIFWVIWRCFFSKVQGSTEINSQHQYCQRHLSCCTVKKYIGFEKPKKTILEDSLVSKLKKQTTEKPKKQSWQSLWTPPSPRPPSNCFLVFWFTHQRVSPDYFVFFVFGHLPQDKTSEELIIFVFVSFMCFGISNFFIAFIKLFITNRALCSISEF